MKRFPDQKGFSARNLKYMRKLAQSYPEGEIVQQAAAQIPWFHNCTILDKVQHAEQREWYIQATIEHAWSRAVLVHQIESDLCGRQGMAVTNFQPYWSIRRRSTVLPRLYLPSCTGAAGISRPTCECGRWGGALRLGLK